jgi:hypothetical protein
MQETKTKNSTDAQMKAFMKGAVYVPSTFTSNSTLWVSLSKSIVIDCTIHASKQNPEKWWVTNDFDNEGVSTGDCYDRIQDRFDAGERSITIKMIHQEPRPEADCGPTIEYVLGLERGKSVIDNYRLALDTPGAVRNSIAILMD